jgi:hypothetical protein
MALLASLREVCRNVIRIVRAPKIFQVACYARSAGKVEVIVDVAIRALAWRYSVPSTQRKTNRGMIKLCVQPVISPMALLAGDREFA